MTLLPKVHLVSTLGLQYFEKAKITLYNIEYRLQYSLFFTFLNCHRNRLFLYFLVNYRILIISLLFWVSIPNSAADTVLEEVVELNKAPENVFKFWKEHAILYPELSILAFQVLCVQATSAPVEQVFRQRGLLFRPHRARLSSDLLSMLVYLKCNKNSSLIVIFAFCVHCSIKIFRFQNFFLFSIRYRVSVSQLYRLGLD